MANRPAFGRRGAAQPVRPAATRNMVRAPQAAAPAIAQAPAPAIADEPRPPTLEDELTEWKRARKRAPIPWRPLYLMASLCFGLASFVLPASIENIVEWPLYGLAAMSFYAGITARRRAKAKKTQTDH